MLKVLRENVKYLSWILWLVIGVFVLFVFLDFGTGVNRGGQGSGWVAEGGGITVSQSEFQQAYRAAEQQARQMYGEQYTPEVAKQLNLPFSSLQQSVRGAILLQEAQRMGFRVSDEELRDQLLAIFHDDQGRFLGEQRYQEILQSQGFSVASFEEEMRQNLLREKLLKALMADVYISSGEIEQAYRNQVEKARVRYVELPRARFADVVVPPAEVSSYFEQHRQDYRLPEQRDGGVLLVEPSRLLDQVQVSDADMQRYYKDHQDEWKQDEQVRASHILAMINDKQTEAQAKAKIDAAKARVDKGEEFGAVARQVSEDPGSKANGGDLGFFGHGRMVKEFEQAAFGSTPGRVVGPFKSPFGYHLLLVTGKRPAGVQPFAEVSQQIRSRLAYDKAREAAEAKARDLATKLANQKPKSADALQAAAKDVPGVTFTALKGLGQQDPVPGLGMAPSFDAAFFAAKEGDVTGAVEVPRGWAVGYLQTVHPPHPAALAEVEPRVRQALFNQKQDEKALERLKAARQEIEHGKTFDQVAVELGVPPKESAEFGANGSIPGLGSSPQLAKLAMTLQNGQLGGPMAAQNGALLFQVMERKSWDPTKFVVAKDQTRQNLLQQRLVSVELALVNKRMRELNITYNRQLLERLGVTIPGTLGQQGG